MLARLLFSTEIKEKVQLGTNQDKFLIMEVSGLTNFINLSTYFINSHQRDFATLYKNNASWVMD